MLSVSVAPAAEASRLPDIPNISAGAQSILLFCDGIDHDVVVPTSDITFISLKLPVDMLKAGSTYSSYLVDKKLLTTIRLMTSAYGIVRKCILGF